MSQVSLIFIFNHKFEKNIARLDAYYESRFSRRGFLMPFATSNDPRVANVVENGATFGGHIAQGGKLYDDPEVTHYVFLGDDLILNPALDERNIIDRLGLAEGQGYLKSLVPADSIRYHWPWSIPSSLNLEGKSLNYKSELPAAEEAQKKFETMGFKFEKPWPRTSKDLRWMTITFPHRMPAWWLENLKWLGKNSKYPLLAGYSDFIVVPKAAIKAFAHYCGVFAAMNMFAEVGVPTALALACDSVKTELADGSHFTDIPMRRSPEALMRGIELWGKEIDTFSEPFEYNWEKFLSSFPSDVLYYHPVKLSKWK